MNIDDLYLDLNNVGMETAVWQTQIQSPEDVAAYQKKGYSIELTEAEFRQMYVGIDPGCICYTPSFSCSSLYFNKETLAVCYLPFIGNTQIGEFFSLEKIKRAIEACEKEAAEKDFLRSIMCMPDKMRFSFFEMLTEKYGTEIPGLYSLFFSVYQTSDYGFGNISPNVVEAVLATKTEEDMVITRERIEELPDVVTVYRGGNSASTSPEEAYSWTTDINVANFFAARRGNKDGYIVRGEVGREDIIEYYPEDGEREVIARPGNVRIQDRICVFGKNFLASVNARVPVMYEAYKKKLETLSFAQESDAHGEQHELRVLLLALLIADRLGLSDAEMDILATAAIYHDTMRINDITDEVHGRESRNYYERNVKKPGLLVALICEYHCLPDEEGYAAIRSTFKNKEKQKRYIRLYDIFKDADALDRVRFCLRDLDLNQLRIPISKQLSLVARLLLSAKLD